MPRRWTSFDEATTNREFRALPHEDFQSLTAAMRLYRQEAGVGYVVRNYGGGLMMIKASNRTQGRCLFFSVTHDGNEQVLTALMIYKKETQEVPDHVMSTARARLRNAENG